MLSITPSAAAPAVDGYPFRPKTAGPARRMRVLHVINSLLTGGAERSLVTHCCVLHELGCAVDVCTLYHGGPLAEPLHEAGIKIHNLALDPGIAEYALRRKYDPRALFRLARIVNSGRYDVVHAHLFPAGLFSALVRNSLTGPRLVFSEHSVFNRRRQKKYLRPIERLIYNRYDAVVAVSPEVAGALESWLPGVRRSLHVIPNGIRSSDRPKAIAGPKELRSKLDISEDANVVLFVGRLEHPKGPDILLRSLPQVFRRNPSTRVLLAGDGPMRDDCWRLIQDLDLGSRAVMLGTRSDVQELMELSDLVVLPSRWEGLPMTLLEAMAAGKPVVASAVGAMPSLVDGSRVGWNVAPEDPAALAEGILVALGQARERTHRGRNGARLAAENYNAETLGVNLLELYRSLQAPVERDRG